MKIFLRRALVDSEAALATMNRISRHRFADDFRRSGQPLLHMPVTVLTLFVFDGAHGLTRQERSVLAVRLSPWLDCFGLYAARAGFDHHVYPRNDFEALYYGTHALLVNHPEPRCLVPTLV